MLYGASCVLCCCCLILAAAGDDRSCAVLVLCFVASVSAPLMTMIASCAVLMLSECYRSSSNMAAIAQGSFPYGDDAPGCCLSCSPPRCAFDIDLSDGAGSKAPIRCDGTLMWIQAVQRQPGGVYGAISPPEPVQCTVDEWRNR